MRAGQPAWLLTCTLACKQACLLAGGSSRGSPVTTARDQTRHGRSGAFRRPSALGEARGAARRRALAVNTPWFIRPVESGAPCIRSSCRCRGSVLAIPSLVGVTRDSVNWHRAGGFADIVGIHCRGIKERFGRSGSGAVALLGGGTRTGRLVSRQTAAEALPVVESAPAKGNGGLRLRSAARSPLAPPTGRTQRGASMPGCAAVLTIGGLPKQRRSVLYRELRQEVPGFETGRGDLVPGTEAGFTGNWGGNFRATFRVHSTIPSVTLNSVV